MVTDHEPTKDEQSPHQGPGDLNREFYNHRPEDYFSRRLALARAMLYDGGELFQLTQDAVEQSGLGGASLSERSSEERRTEVGKYVATDLEMLKFHAIETMLRYFQAHATAPDRAWQKISGLEDRFSLSRELRTMWNASHLTRQSMIARVCFGIADEATISPDLLSPRTNRLLGVEAFLSHFIDYYVDWGDDSERHRERERYNAAKHGLALIPVPMEQSGTNQDVQAMWLTHLDYRRDEGKGRWTLKVSWTDLEVVMYEILRAVELLELTWTVGKQGGAATLDIDDLAGGMEWSPAEFARFDIMLATGRRAWTREFDQDDE